MPLILAEAEVGWQDRESVSEFTLNLFHIVGTRLAKLLFSFLKQSKCHNEFNVTKIFNSLSWLLLCCRCCAVVVLSSFPVADAIWYLLLQFRGWQRMALGTNLSLTSCFCA